MAAVRDRAIALATLARTATTTTDPQSRSFRWAQFDRDRDELVRRLAPLGTQPDHAVAASEIDRAVADLAAAIAYDRDLRIGAGGSATAEQLAIARTGVLEHASALVDAAAPTPVSPPD